MFLLAFGVSFKDNLYEELRLSLVMCGGECCGAQYNAGFCDNIAPQKYSVYFCGVRC
jgi:hypothetical protein